MKNKYFHSLVWLLISIFSLAATAAEVVDKEDDHIQIKTGWLESVILEPWKIKLIAKLDTGAKTSSLHAIDIHRFEQDGVPWVRFKTHSKKQHSQIEKIELPVKRNVKIKSHHNGFTVRPVVELQFCLNGQHYKGEFSLIDRTEFNYPVLLGRRILKQGIMVDASATFLLKTNTESCKQNVKRI